MAATFTLLKPNTPIALDISFAVLREFSKVSGLPQQAKHGFGTDLHFFGGLEFELSLKLWMKDLLPAPHVCVASESVYIGLVCSSIALGCAPSSLRLLGRPLLLTGAHPARLVCGVCGRVAIGQSLRSRGEAAVLVGSSMRRVLRQGLLAKTLLQALFMLAFLLVLTSVVVFLLLFCRSTMTSFSTGVSSTSQM